MVNSDSDHIFDTFSKVTYYGLLHHKIEHISSENFTSCLWLEGLDISQGKLLSIDPDAFQDFARIRDIDLSKNELDYIHPQTFSTLSTLEKLNLSDNKLIAVEMETFNNNRKLNMLNLKNNQIAFIASRGFEGLYSLRELYLTGNACINTDYKPPRIPSLRYVFLQQCKETVEITEFLAERYENEAE